MPLPLRLLPFSLLLACDPSEAVESGTGGNADSGPVGDPATVSLAGECAMDVDFGGFTVTDNGETTDVAGKVADGVVPIAVLEPIATEGDCQVLRQNNPHCEPTCDPGQTCDFDGLCVPYPINQDLGTVTITGLVDAVTMEPAFPGNTYYNSTALPHPAITADVAVRLGMPAGAYGPAELFGVGFESLVVSDAGWSITEGADLVVGWAAPKSAAPRSEVVLSVSIDQHGVSPSSLRCVFADTGSGTVPAAAITALVGAGVTGFPNGALERRTVDKAVAGAGCFDFALRSPRTVQVDVGGHTPCVSTVDCPDGQTCNEELQTCQ
ncbi:hypothetical protein LBMAG42_14880 [Deltaproteobacteria bacterium]|nr:hypothetical protein LBMAG42_14880 [Deltaproteobacteria bacterium]